MAGALDNLNASGVVDDEPLVPSGNPLRPRSFVTLALGFVTLCVLFATDARWPFSLPVGLLAAGAAAFGALDFTGCFDDRGPSELGSWTLSRLEARLLEVCGALVCAVLAFRLAVAGVLPTHAFTASAAVTLAAVLTLVATARLVAFVSDGDSPAIRSHPGFWLVLTGVLLYVPLAGGYSLLDPWETHYGEVAREMLARDDWISLWWAQEGFFWSKPALDFWLQGLSFLVGGVRYRPDEMLSAVAQGYVPQPEWAARLPIALLALLAAYLLYRWVAACAGKRAGWLAGFVLLCVPYWSLLAHQSMTDMPYVASLTAALSLFGLGLITDSERRAPSLTLVVAGRRLRLSAFHGLMGVVLLTALPQLAYLVSRNVTLQWVAPPYGFRWHWDEFEAGSGLGNCGIPGNQACRSASPANALFQPFVGATVFGCALGYLLHLNRGERRVQRLCFLGAWYFTALAALAKGAPGLVLPITIAAATLVARRSWRDLLRVEIAGFGLMLAAVCLPWYVQAYVRHGDAFTDRLLLHDMYLRAFEHVHDTNAGTDVSLRYYVWQLGYGLFPLTGLAAVGLARVFGDSEGSSAPLRLLSQLSVLWLLICFSLFTLSLTKFHHYALPCAPPLAVGAGLLLDESLGDAPFPRGKQRVLYFGALAAAAVLLVAAALGFHGGSLAGRLDAEGRPFSAWPLAGLVCLLVGTAFIAGVAWRWHRSASEAPPGSTMLGALTLIGAAATWVIARDMSTSVPGGVPGSARLLHLITYNYKRAWPATLDFEGATWAFGAAFALASAGLAWSRLRRPAALLVAMISASFCAFTLWIYLPRLAPHFGQRDLLATYYRVRKGPDELAVAYQMNWKGENFYTGNRLPAFVTSGKKLKSWLRGQQKAGRKVLFFLAEHNRIGALKGELGPSTPIERLTDRSFNDKFALVRAELGALPAEDEAVVGGDE